MDEELPKEVAEAFQNEQIDALENTMIGQGELVTLPVDHSFVPGMYVREIFMPAGTLLTSKIHNTEHPYVVLSGVVKVYIPEVGMQVITGGYRGVTKAGTRRVLHIEQDCHWVTFHSLSVKEEEARASGMEEQELLTMIESRIIKHRELPGHNGKTTFQAYEEKLSAQEAIAEIAQEEGAAL